MGKGKVHYIEVLSDEEDDGEDETTHTQGNGQRSGEVEPSHLEVTTETPLQEGVNRVTIATLSGVPRYYTFRIRGLL